MKPIVFLSLCLLFVIYSCNNFDKKTAVKKTPIHTIGDKKAISADTSGKNLVPVFGYRFAITGDFNGDGKKEKLTEHFISRIDNCESDKFYEGLKDYNQLVELTMRKKPISLVTCDDKSIHSLLITSHRNLGLAYLKNEGDLNGDGTDEVSYVIDWTDWSNLNSWNIVTYKNGKWKDLYSFPIWDWQLPDLPQTYNQYGPVGLENKIINTKNTKANKEIEDSLNSFKGLVKKISNNKIQIIYDNKESVLDTAVVKLKAIN